MSHHPAYANYWKRKQLLQQVPDFPLKYWWPTDSLSEIEQIYFDSIITAKSLLDFGAGDLRMKRKLQNAGFRGEYETLDIGGEFEHTYSELSEVKRTFDAILMLDVIEHLTLTEGLTLLLKFVDLLEPGGVLIVQTPNARCVRNQLGTDMTHVQIYNTGDLWSFLTAAGLKTAAFRVNLGRPQRGLMSLISRFVISRFLGADYADNIAVIGRK